MRKLAEQVGHGAPTTDTLCRFRLVVTGRVQGVGFRPFVYRLATHYGLSGSVGNSPAGVVIDIQGSPLRIEEFRAQLAADNPPQARIERIISTRLRPIECTGFQIAESTSLDRIMPFITPDLAVCDDCLREIQDPGNRRYRYPFTNCTNCGPRFSIITNLPYDREHTSMRQFSMCPQCRAEYEDPMNRRFHAQPNACPLCGPRIQLMTSSGQILACDDDALIQTAAAIRAGQIIALKGIGGYQLLADARNEKTIQLLRKRKARPEKPLAMMYPSLEMIERHCIVSDDARIWLTSVAAPIVLLPLKTTAANDADHPTAATTCGINSLGVMLPCTPLHYLLMKDLGFPIVATSGNRSGDPICTDTTEALSALAGLADLFLSHDRPIVRPIDDSVVRADNGCSIVIRLARGLAPSVIDLNSQSAPHLAAGSHLKNAFALTIENKLVLMHHMGDLESPQARANYESAIEDLTDLYDCKAESASSDPHPDYYSTRTAQSYDPNPYPVQHHVAHILTGIAEHKLSGPVIGISWDGAGLGDDGVIWGGETFLIDDTSYRRVAGLRSFRLPGGDAAARDPRRTAIGLLYEIYGSSLVSRLPRHLKEVLTEAEVDILTRMCEHGVNSPRTTSAGRLFDGVAALIGICPRRCTFEGQAAMLLEDTAIRTEDDSCLPYSLIEGSPAEIDWAPMIDRLLAGIEQHAPVSLLARQFHNTLADMTVRVALRYDVHQIVLGGGCFQNTLLLSICRRRLSREGWSVYWPQSVPLNDGGLAVGQALAAMKGLRKAE